MTNLQTKEKRWHGRKRVICAMLLVLILAGGMFFGNDSSTSRPGRDDIRPTSSAATQQKPGATTPLKPTLN